MHLFAEAPLRSYAEAVADDEHTDHQLRINRRTTGVAIATREMLAQFTQVEKLIYAS
jgi:hypothetical protein